MHAVLSVLLPIFGLILVGAACGRAGWLGDGATGALNRFVVRLALPAELFESMAQATGAQLDHPGFVAAFGGGMLATFAIGFGLDWRRPAGRPHRLAAAAMEGLAASYANTAFIGIPLCLGVFGPAGLPPVVLASILTVVLLFALGIALVELDGQPGQGQGQGWGQGLGRTAARVLLALARNPLVAAPAAGLLANLSGLGPGAPLLRLTGLLGGAASPCALVTIGLFLAEPGGGARVPAATVARAVALKLLVQPALTALLALLLPMPRLWAEAAVLIAALPLGTGPFMLARLYEREAGVAGRATLVSTVLSLLTVSLLLAWLG